MKKYKVHFSLFNLFLDTQAMVVKLQLLCKTLTVAIAAVIWEETDIENAKWAALAGIIIDTAIGCLYLEEKTSEPLESKINVD